MTAVIYARYSSDNQREESIALCHCAQNAFSTNVSELLRRIAGCTMLRFLPGGDLLPSVYSRCHPQRHSAEIASIH